MQQKVTVPSQVMVRQVGEDAVILDLVSGTYYGLDAVGARMWAFMQQGQSLQQVCASLLAEYDVTPAQLERDMQAMVKDLLDHKLIELTE